MRKKHSTANILLIELVLVILFFMLCVSTIVEMFGLARGKSATARAGSEALLVVENLEERLAATADAAEELEKLGFIQDGDQWILQEEHYTLRAVAQEERMDAGQLRTVTFFAEQKTGQTLFELPVTNYLPGEVSP
ncbi:MAG: hypothetical protein IJ188_10170 [Clostridia bacterium]|nr:hypothetical protein [Clostridia bacterium]